MGRYDLTDFEWRVIEPLQPNKPRGVPRVDDRRVLNGILWVLRSGALWRDLPDRYGPYTTCYNRFNPPQDFLHEKFQGSLLLFDVAGFGRYPDPADDLLDSFHTSQVLVSVFRHSGQRFKFGANCLYPIAALRARSRYPAYTGNVCSGNGIITPAPCVRRHESTDALCTLRTRDRTGVRRVAATCDPTHLLIAWPLAYSHGEQAAHYSASPPR